jgi:hypothetical protein
VPTPSDTTLPGTPVTIAVDNPVNDPAATP